MHQRADQPELQRLGDLGPRPRSRRCAHVPPQLPVDPRLGGSLDVDDQRRGTQPIEINLGDDRVL
jgi:hypothetical protein